MNEPPREIDTPQGLNHRGRVSKSALRGLVFLGLMVGARPALGQGLLSAPETILDPVGTTLPALLPTLGVPDHRYSNGFLPGAAATYQFAAPVEDVAGPDLLIWAFVYAQGSLPTDVIVEGRAASTDEFLPLAMFSTDQILPDDQHTQVADGGRGPYTDYDHVHPFPVFLDGQASWVTEVRIRNLGPNPLGLDALEAIHPAVAGPDHAVELRVFRRRDDFSKRFALRFKNLASRTTGVPMAGFRIEHTVLDYIDQTDMPVVGLGGQFEATPATTAGPDNGPTTQLTDYAWIGQGQGLNPGDVATHVGWNTIDTDVPGDEFFENIVVTIQWADGTSKAVDWLDLVNGGASGAIFALYQFPPAAVTVAEPRPTFSIEVADGPLRPQDPVPPTAPTNLLALPGVDFVDLSWTASTDNVGVQEYRVERSSNGFGFEEVTVVDAPTVVYQDTGLETGALYFYRVYAVDVNGVAGPPSALVMARTLGAADTTPPTPPTNLSGLAVAEDQVNLIWDPATDDRAVVDYVIERALPGEDFAPAGAVAANTNTYQAKGLPPETMLRFRVRARDAALNTSEPSNELMATTFPATAVDGGIAGGDGGVADAGPAPRKKLDSGLDCRAVAVPEGAPGAGTAALWLLFVGGLGRRAARARRPSRGAQRQ